MKKKPAKRKAAKRPTSSARGPSAGRDGANDSPEAVLAAVDKFVAAKKAAYERLSAKLEKAKRDNPAQHRELLITMRELSEALKLRARVAKVVMDVSQRLRLIENSARFAIATA
ncbi:MAG TPA: hypothetical protein VIV40_13870, partial [Kofleriaceae bacterium]